MKSIIWRVKKIESEDIRKSTWPKGIREYREFKKNIEKFHDVIGVWLCIEESDKEEYLDSLVERIINLNNQFYKLKKIVVVPFAHLSNKLEHPEKSKKLFEKLTEKLKEKNFETYRITFGTHKRFLWEVMGQVAGASYFEFPFSGQKFNV